MQKLPQGFLNIFRKVQSITPTFLPPKINNKYLYSLILDLVLIVLIVIFGRSPIKQVLSQNVDSHLKPITETKSSREVFGFAPYWNFDKLSAVDFKVLTTLAYFGVDVNGNGDLVRDDVGFSTFKSDSATQLFKKAHDNGTRVVLTVTQMNNYQLTSLLSDQQAQDNAVAQIVDEVKARGIDGVNVDFEYNGDPGDQIRNNFSQFVADLTEKMHQRIPHSKVTVSVYAASMKDPKIYDIEKLGRISDGIFMMAYDFASTGSDLAVPTSPLSGHKEGKYWYDISTAVDDFLAVISPQKLILGIPWYGYNYLVHQPEVGAATRPYYLGGSLVQTYANAAENKPDMTGWDDYGKVGWQAYFVPSSNTWKMFFLEDSKSLGIKYDFAKSKNLAGIGIWALGFEDGQSALWEQLRDKLGSKT